jgi:uncharacterized repeat protein (TIGR02543 family)
VWAKDENGSGKPDFSENLFRVTYIANGASGGAVPVDPYPYAAGQSATILGNTSLIRTGYTFAGWHTEPDVTFGAAGSVTTYTAQWTVTKNTVTFSAGDHGAFTVPSDPLANQEVDYGASVSDVPTVVEDANYTFVGWMSSDSSDVYSSAAVAALPVTASVTYTAQYVLDANATVIFDYNGGTADDASSSMISGLPGTTYIVPTPTRTGYTLSNTNGGWDAEPTKTFGAAGSITTYTAQ